MPACLQREPKASEVYCDPWSEWWMTLSGRRCPSAMSSASRTRPVLRCVAIDQPTMRRLKASGTTADPRPSNSYTATRDTNLPYCRRVVGR